MEINENVENKEIVNNTEIVVEPTKSPKKIFKVIGIGCLVTAFLVGAYYLGANKDKFTKNKISEVLPEKQEESVSENKALFEGKLKRLDQNLMIFKDTEDDKLNKIENNFVYYEAGKFLRGELKGYTRVIAIRPPDSPEGAIIYTLATKDFQRYIIDDPNNKWNEKIDNGYDIFYYLDRSKIDGAKVFDEEAGKEIDLDKNNALYFKEYANENVEKEGIDANGNKLYESVLVTDLSDYKKLEVPNTNLGFYYLKYKLNQQYIDNASASEKVKILQKQKYILGDTEVMVIDSTGLPKLYSQSTPEKIKKYIAAKTKYDIDLVNYNNQVKKYVNKEISEYPKYPTYVYTPSLGFKESEIKLNGNLNLFSDYETAIPEACATSLNTKVANISDDELEVIGKFGNTAVYKLKDNQHPLYSLAYKNKMDYYLGNENEEWNYINKNISKPSLEEYVAKTPLLFTKDYWQRWIMFGEYDINLPGGCGKPVIYLYPKKEMEVTVKLQMPVKFTTDIPKYNDFWKVLARKDGSLINLKNESSDCKLIDGNKFGSEYAKEACEKNIYPYLYWSGQVISKNYPEIKEGWIIEKNNLKNFLENKLTEIGFNSKERNDFVSYWVPEMLAKNSPYYRVSFLQSREINEIFPMEVNPKPETIFRLFMDYSALEEKPKNAIGSPKLDKLVRQGFTLVEWGGINK